jgi:hypothetical protein
MPSTPHRFVPATLAAMAVSLWLCLAGAAFAADAKEKKPEPPLFQTQAPLAVTLQAPWAELLRNPKDPRKYPAVLSYGDAHRLDATVQTRGITRLRICRFPPIRLRFEKAATAGSEFAGQDALKLVTHCKTGDDYLYVQELLAYRIYNLMTPQSFRARPLEVTYRDSQGGKSEGPRFAFLIEDASDMARRNDLERDKRPRLRPADYDPLALSRLMLFEYLIGNTDWDVTAGPHADECCHNTRIFSHGDGKRVAVPYDFDSAGLVAASYAAPHASLPIKDVRQRLFRGFCVHNDALPAARAEFLARRAAIMQLIDGETRLGERKRKAVAKYVEDFYATLDSDEAFAREITAKCRK